jgi:hypothetical protein
LKLKKLEAEEVVAGEVRLRPEAAGKGVIAAGKTEILIETPQASQDAQIYITPVGKKYGRELYIDEIKDGKSFKVKIEGATLTEEIKFNWLIINIAKNKEESGKE